MKQRNSDKLENAMRSLEDAIKYTRTAEYQELGAEFKNVLQSAVVQNFSLTFKVCRKMLYHQLVDRHGAEKIDALDEKGLISMAAEEKLISNRENWLEYLDCEHLTHSGTIAVRTFEKASAFLTDSAELLTTCQKRTQNERRKR